MFWGPYSRPYASFIPSDFMSQVWSEENTNAYFPRPRGYVALGSNRELAVVNTKYLRHFYLFSSCYLPMLVPDQYNRNVA